MYAALRTDLAHRRSDGIDVTSGGSRRRHVAVEVLHLASDSSFELAVAPARSTPTTTPFAYAARRSPELLDVAA